MLRATIILFTFHLWRLCLSHRLLVCLGVSALPVAAAYFIKTISSYTGPPPAVELAWFLIVQFVVPVLALILGSAVVAEEVEDRTITYLFTRPIPRMTILLGRWLASLVILCSLLLACVLLTVQFLGESAAGDHEHALPAGSVAALCQVAVAGGIVYSALFAACGALVRRPIILGLGYTFAVEAFLGNLPGKNQALTIQYYLRSYLCGQSDAILARMQQLTDGPNVAMATANDALATLVYVLVTALVVGCWTISRRQYVLTS
ncbi:MAG: hypothetical protein CMJ59_15245 [Planctomycetaceae bacterium]|nr:hypothetical protein [Planctomycetaceae bacterium]